MISAAFVLLHTAYKMTNSVFNGQLTGLGGDRGADNGTAHYRPIFPTLREAAMIPRTFGPSSDVH